MYYLYDGLLISLNLQGADDTYDQGHMNHCSRPSEFDADWRNEVSEQFNIEM